MRHNLLLGQQLVCLIRAAPFRSLHYSSCSRASQLSKSCSQPQPERKQDAGTSSIIMFLLSERQQRNPSTNGIYHALYSLLRKEFSSTFTNGWSWL